MTLWTLAIHRAARQLMTEDELRLAADLTRDADRGNTSAASLLRFMAFEIVTDRRRIERAKAAGAAD